LDFREDFPEAGAEIEVELKDGRKASATFDAGIPSADIADQEGGSPRNSTRSPRRSSAPPAPAKCARRSPASTGSRMRACWRSWLPDSCNE